MARSMQASPGLPKCAFRRASEIPSKVWPSPPRRTPRRSMPAASSRMRFIPQPQRHGLRFCRATRPRPSIATLAFSRYSRTPTEKGVAMNPRSFLTRSLAALALCGLLFATAAGCREHEVHAASVVRGLDAAETPTGLAARGKLIFDQTPRFAQPWVGNRLACSDCHLRSGTADYAAPMIDLSGMFPAFNKRAGHVISLRNRIQECFSRSEAGSPLPENSPQMQALVAYVNWLSRNGAKGKAYKARGLVKLPLLHGDPARGQTIYAARCAGCHGADGAGVPPILPAVWGDGSYNDGSGMNNSQKMAAFVFHNMPQNAPGTLTVQEAYDVSAFIHTMPRQQF